MVSEAPNGTEAGQKDVELSQSDKNQEGEESLDKAHKEERTLPSFFPSHGLTTAGGARSWAPCWRQSTALHDSIGLEGG